jgi:peptide deformylase
MIDAENCQLTHYPAQVLAEPSKKVEKIDDNIRQLIKKMAEIMQQSGGIGLAAPQIGVPLRIFIIALDTDKQDLKAYINPTVITEGTLEAMEEGCLSVPEVYTKVKRHKKCRVTATDLDGNEFTEEAEGLYARCLQHENDHINGVTIVNRMGQAAKIVHRRKLKKLEQKHENPPEE